MKKSFVQLFGVATIALALASCGDKYTPMTEEVKAAKADSLFTAQSAELKKQKEDACASEMQAKVDAKVQEMMASVAEPTAAK